MPRKLIGLIICLALIYSCAESIEKDEPSRPMVYEGMSAAELLTVLGEPNEIENKGEIFDAETMTKIPLEHWQYDKRVVVLINDTVKTTNLN